LPGSTIENAEAGSAFSMAELSCQTDGRTHARTSDFIYKIGHFANSQPVFSSQFVHVLTLRIIPRWNWGNLGASERGKWRILRSLPHFGDLLKPIV